MLSFLGAPVFGLGWFFAQSEGKFSRLPVAVQGATSGRKCSNKKISAACPCHDKRGALKPAILRGLGSGRVAQVWPLGLINEVYGTIDIDRRPPAQMHMVRKAAATVSRPAPAISITASGKKRQKISVKSCSNPQIPGRKKK